MSKILNFIKKHFLFSIVILALFFAGLWYCIGISSALHIVNNTFNVSLARDSKTGQYIGEVITEIKDESGRSVKGYRIKRNDGSVIEKQVGEVVIFNP